MNITPNEFAKLFGIHKSSLYLRLSGDRDWQLPELIKLCELADGEIDIELSGKTYRITIQNV